MNPKRTKIPEPKAMYFSKNTPVPSTSKTKETKQVRDAAGGSLKPKNNENKKELLYAQGSPQPERSQKVFTSSVTFPQTDTDDVVDVKIRNREEEERNYFWETRTRLLTMNNMMGFFSFKVS